MKSMTSSYLKCVRSSSVSSAVSCATLSELVSTAVFKGRRRLLSAAIVLALTSACTSERHIEEQGAQNDDNAASVIVEEEVFADRTDATVDAGKQEHLTQSLPLSEPILSKPRPTLESHHQRIAMAIEHKKASAQMMKRAAVGGHREIIHSPIPQWQDRESYLPQTANPVHKVSQSPVSTFSIDVDTASYSNVRRMIQREGRLPPRDAVKAEEFINYFSYQYPQPETTEQPFSVHTELIASPWNKNTKLLKIGLQGYQVIERPAANLVFLVDVSGSMQSQHKLGLAKRSLKMLVQQMRKDDRMALVVYAGAAGLVLPSTSGDQKQMIFSAIDQLTAGGSTHGSAGIQLAYQVAKEHFIKDGINRVLVASDGDMNVGTVDHNALKDLVVRHRDSGIALSTLGFGSGNYNYALMEQLADVGNGSAAYVDSLKEAHRVLVQQMNSTLMTIAKDVKIQVEFNPQYVSEYRLIGYENRMLKQEDFRNDKVDAGEIGAGHSVTALYELTMVGSGGQLIPELRYAHPADEDKKSIITAVSDAASVNELGFVKLRYKQPDADTSQLITMPLASSLLTGENTASTDMKFSAAVAGFAQLLRGGTYLGSWGYDELLSLARANRGSDEYGHRAEFVNLIELSQQWRLAQHAGVNQQ